MPPSRSVNEPPATGASMVPPMRRAPSITRSAPGRGHPKAVFQADVQIELHTIAQRTAALDGGERRIHAIEHEASAGGFELGDGGVRHDVTRQTVRAGATGEPEGGRRARSQSGRILERTSSARSESSTTGPAFESMT